MERFMAKAIAGEEIEELNTFSVVLAENPNGSGIRVEIHRAITFDYSDRNTGMDTYCLCTEWGATHYGGVSCWEMDNNSLRIYLNAETCRVLNVENGFEIDFCLSIQEREHLLNSLVRVFGFGPRSTFH